MNGLVSSAESPDLQVELKLMDSRLHRFFVPPEWLHGQRALLEGQVARQMSRVLRMACGDRVILLDNTGSEYLAELDTFHGDRIEGRIVSSTTGLGEPQTTVTLCQSLLKGDKMDWVLQKGTELGASAFVPVISQRAVRRSGKGEQQMARWRRIITEAAEQSGRSILPQICPPITLREALDRCPEGSTLMPYEEERETSLREALKSARHQLGPLSFFIGPEGGWDSAEVSLARSHGVKVVSLGQRILRAETAAIAAKGH